MSEIKERAVYEIKLKDDQFARGLSNAEVKMDSFESSLKGVGATIAAVFAADRIISFGNDAVRVAAKTESLNNAIRFASGPDGAKNLEYLNKLSRDLGLNLMATTEGFKTFSGALIGSKFEGQAVRDIYTKIAYGITTMGLSSDDAKGAMIALGQMVSKGTVSAEELRGQLGERLPGAFQIAARAMGVTTKELGDMLKKGEVVTDVFLPKFADEMEKTFKGGVEASANSMQANLNRIENKIHSFTEGVGSLMMPFIMTLGRETKAANEEFYAQKEAFDGLISTAPPLIDRYRVLMSQIHRTADEQTELHEITQRLATAMPDAVLKWDAYGNAIELSNRRMKEHIKTSREALTVYSKDAVDYTRDRITESFRIVTTIQDQLNEAAKDPNGRLGILGRDQSVETLRFLKESLRAEQEKLTALKEEYQNIKKGVNGDQRLRELQEGILNRDKMFSGLAPSPEASVIAKLLEGFSSEAKSSAETKLKKIFSGLTEKGKADKLSELTEQLSSLSPERRLAAINEMAKGAKSVKGSKDIGVEKIQAGTRNVTVNIQTIKLAENIVSHKADLSDARVQEMLQRAILTAINDVNIVAQ